MESYLDDDDDAPPTTLATVLIGHLYSLLYAVTGILLGKLWGWFMRLFTGRE